jgi:hypothetical protein
MDAERAFARLEEMVAELPAIQAEDARLAQAREARVLREAHRRAAALEAEIDGYSQTIDTALVEAKAASDQQDAEEEGHNLALVRMYTELRYTRLATMQRAQDEVRSLLAQGSLTLEDSLDEYALPDEDYEALEAAIRAFQEEYQQLYALCRRLEGME